jgi:putative ABC transport system permease protein
MFQDIRFGLRTIRKNKAVTGIAALCLAIGIGMNTMMFSIVDGVLIQSLPYRDAERLVQFHTTNQYSAIRFGGVSWLDLREWRERATSFEAIAGLQYRSFTIGDQNDPQRYAGAAIGHELFPMLGIDPQLGRAFSADDDRPGAEPVVLLSDVVWQQRYHGDPGIVGRPILVNSRPHTVVGVMPPNFEFPQNQQVWLPLAEYANTTNRGERALVSFARLKPGIPLARAQQEVEAIARQLAATYQENQHWSAWVRALRYAFIPDDVRRVLVAMMGAVTLILLIACFNVANLLLARASARSREISIRSALGAGRSRILRQLLTESVLVGIASIPLGILLAWFSLRLLDASVSRDQMPYYVQWAIDTRVLLYAVALAVLTGVVFGLAPALQASRVDLQEALKEGGRGSSGAGRAWMRNVLVVAEIALSLVLLVGASLFIRSFVNLQQASGGFSTAPLMTLRFYMPLEQYKDDDARTRRVEDLVRRVRSVPAVQAVFASNMVPLGGGGGGASIAIEGRPVEGADEPIIDFIGVTSQMLPALGLSLLRGREFTDTESLTRQPLAVVNQAMAKKFWPNDDPIGRRFRARINATLEWFTVIGIAPDIRHSNLNTAEPVGPCAYVPFPYGAFPNTGLTIRAAGDPALVSAPVREAIRASDPTLAVFQVYPMEELRRRGFWQFRLFGWMFGIWGLVALLLAAVGVYGVLSYSVAQRTQEIGVRVALGAARRDVLRLVLAYGWKLAILGVVFGLVGAFLITGFIRTLLFNVSATDPLSFGAVSIFLVAVALLASYVPARRATAVDPLTALRAE